MFALDIKKATFQQLNFLGHVVVYKVVNESSLPYNTPVSLTI